jgi:hypothetical protein
MERGEFWRLGIPRGIKERGDGEHGKRTGEEGGEEGGEDE